MDEPGTSADASKLTSTLYKKVPSSDSYPSSVTSGNMLLGNDYNTHREKNIISTKKVTVKQAVMKKVSSKRVSVSKTSKWANSDDFPYVPSIQSLPHSTVCHTFDRNDVDNPELHTLYCRSDCRCSGQCSFCESNRQMTNRRSTDKRAI